MKSELVVGEGLLSILFEEDVSAQVNKFGLAVQVWQVLDFQEELKWQVVFVTCLDLDLVALAVLHLWQEAGLVLGATGQGLLGSITLLKARSLETSDQDHQVTGTACDSLVLGEQGLNAVVDFVVYQESVLVLVIKLLV